MADEKLQDDSESYSSTGRTVVLCVLGAVAIYFCQRGASVASREWGLLLLGCVVVLMTLIDLLAEVDSGRCFGFDRHYRCGIGGRHVDGEC